MGCEQRPCAPYRNGVAETGHVRCHGTGEKSGSDQDVQAVSEPEEKALLGQSFFSPGYCVDTAGLDSEIAKYVRYMQQKEGQIEVLELSK